MLIEILRKLFNRDLNRLKTEIAAYQAENNLWATANGISNSAGNLCLHLVGNLNAFIGAALGATGYVRNRELEFSLRDVATAQLIKDIDATMVMVDDTLARLPEERLQDEYPLLVQDEKISTALFLMHLATHLSYHLGQINYHRRLLETPAP